MDTALSGCTIGVQVGGADAVVVSPDDDDVYVTSFLSNSVTAFTRTATTGQLAQQTGTSACAIYVLAVGCSLARAFSAPEGLVVSPDGASVYTTAFASGALDVFNRGESGALIQKPRSAGCMTTSATAECTPARGLLGASSAAVSPDGRYRLLGGVCEQRRRCLQADHQDGAALAADRKGAEMARTVPRRTAGRGWNHPR